MSSEQVATAQPVASGRVARPPRGGRPPRHCSGRVRDRASSSSSTRAGGRRLDGARLGPLDRPARPSLARHAHVLGHGRAGSTSSGSRSSGSTSSGASAAIKLALLVHALLVTSGLAGAALIARSHGATARSVTWIAIPALIAYYPVASVMRPQSFAFPALRRPCCGSCSTTRGIRRAACSGRCRSSCCGRTCTARSCSVPCSSRSPASSAMVRAAAADGRGLALLLAPWACVFASPYALHLPAYYEKILVGGNFKQFVTEWAPTTLAIVDRGRLSARARRRLAARPERAARSAVRPARVRRSPPCSRSRPCGTPPGSGSWRSPCFRRSSTGCAAAGGGAAAPEPDPRRDDPGCAVVAVAVWRRSRRAGSRADSRRKARKERTGGRADTDACSPRAHTATGCSGAEPAWTAGSPTTPASSSSRPISWSARAFPAAPATGSNRSAAIGVFVLDPAQDQRSSSRLRRALPARVVFSSPQVVVLRRRG